MSTAIQLRLESLPQLDELGRLWRRLEPHSASSFFTSWPWIGTWLTTLPDRRDIALLRGTAGGETVALAVVGRRSTTRHRVFRSHGLYLNRSGDPRFDCVFIEYNGLLAARACADGMLGLAVEWFRTEQRQSDEFYLSGITTPARLTPDLMQELTAMPSFAVDLTGLANTGGDVAALLSGNARQQLRRAQRSFAAFGPLTLSEASSADEALSYFAGLKQLHIPSWERRNKAHSFTNPYFERFHCHLIEQHFACGCVQMLRIAAGDELLGYLYNFRHDGKIYAYQSGFADADRQRRPGAVGHYLAINHNHRLGARSYDFMAGRNQLKETFATDRTELFWQVVQRRALKFRLERGARAVKRAFTG